MLHVCMLMTLVSVVMLLRLAPEEQAASPGPILLVATDAPAHATGAAITFSLSLDNPSDFPVTLGFSSEQRLDLAIFSEERELWRWAAGRDFADTESEETFPPGVMLLGRITWNGRAASGDPLPPGSYRAVGTLTATGAQRQSSELLLRLTRGDGVD